MSGAGAANGRRHELDRGQVAGALIRVLLQHEEQLLLWPSMKGQVSRGAYPAGQAAAITDLRQGAGRRGA